ncbi:unnamed protein product [Soboliphyme baturini]|uniref:Uncharacterized protein n=1 Tax=Soboliphyme baturini TaxID=241478 RepID=A0A183IJB3_9BILA|nr:unnamed protein product [Soboliphyme baturini]
METIESPPKDASTPTNGEKWHRATRGRRLATKAKRNANRPHSDRKTRSELDSAPHGPEAPEACAAAVNRPIACSDKAFPLESVVRHVTTTDVATKVSDDSPAAGPARKMETA